MKKAAKLVMIDPQDKYLLLYRSAHPAFGDDPDIPGGTVEDEETMHEALVREVQEEVGVAIDDSAITQVYSGSEYSAHTVHYALFTAKVEVRPELTLSWEHGSYEWLSRDEFLAKAQHAKDTYMHMVFDVMRHNEPGFEPQA